ncbi:metal-dependent hydrolase [Streptomyces sp. MS1.AVA.4]|uniref:Metal-dependent hydrolase n=1 Tax=Streptomyces pratisoli TaxID=3139917 RepID=A0ACC6QEX6_9ACTN
MSNTRPVKVASEHTALTARKVSFAWEETPLHWVPGDPFATHTINVLHLLLPAGERWFVHVYKQVLPHIHDDRLREDVIGFIGQEAVHSQAHDDVLPHLRELGLDPTPYTAQVDWFFEKLLGDRTLPPGKPRAWWLKERVALIAAIEHYTAFLGDWVLNAGELDRRGADPMMLDLLRWHGAEEVEHRSVAFDLFMHVDGSYRRRVRTWAAAFSALVFLWQRGARFFMENDPTLPDGRASFRDFYRAGTRGVLPSTPDLLRSIPRYLSRAYHPSQEGSTAQAVAYLASSPGANGLHDKAMKDKGLDDKGLDDKRMDDKRMDGKGVDDNGPDGPCPKGGR